jgi:hypothetical protein
MRLGPDRPKHFSFALRIRLRLILTRSTSDSVGPGRTKLRCFETYRALHDKNSSKLSSTQRRYRGYSSAHGHRQPARRTRMLVPRPAPSERVARQRGPKRAASRRIALEDTAHICRQLTCPGSNSSYCSSGTGPIRVAAAQRLAPGDAVRVPSSVGASL